MGSFSPLAAQQEDDWNDDEEEEVPSEGDWAGFIPSLYSRGDQAFNISLGVTIPTVFTNADGDFKQSIQQNILVGGTGSLSYDYFLGSHFFVGGELQGMFASTKGDHMLFIIPINVRIGYQFVFRRFEFPLSLGLGIAPQKLQEFDYLGFFAKPKASIFFRFNPEWSFGINTAWWWVPEITEKRAEWIYGNFFEATIAVRYHF
ncbi:MAG: hypothetical protein LBT39_00415 [Treponema sp.]|nr:hypothetical protein [Treponema sp.]